MQRNRLQALISFGALSTLTFAGHVKERCLLALTSDEMAMTLDPPLCTY